MSKKIAIIGAGVSGANLASKLSSNGFDVTVFEKARGPGGRTSSRRFSDGDKTYTIDHGAQYIDVVSDEFRIFIESLEQAGVVEEFTKLGTQNTYVPVPAMNSFTKHLMSSINAKYEIQVHHVIRKDNLNFLYDDKGNRLGGFDLVISTAPPKQTAELFKGYEKFEFLSKVEMKVHFAVMLISSKIYDFGFSEMNVQDSMLNWIGINSQKPKRDKALGIILHTNFKWSLENAEMDRVEITNLALKELESQTGFKDENPIYLACHRWLYGRTLEPLNTDFIFDQENNLACCGDYMLGDNIEAAFLSSSRLADKLIKNNYR